MIRSFCRENKTIKCAVAAAALLMGLSVGIMNPAVSRTVSAAEAGGYYDEAGNWVEEQVTVIGEEETAASSSETEAVQPAGQQAAVEPETEAAQEALTGTYTMESGWSADDSQSTSDKTVYKMDAFAGTENTSTITCSYLDTSYSVLEYEQLRDMLTNNLLYSNVNAQISTSAAYTDAKDYLYILIVDDSAQDYRNIYCYVVGDYRCFCVEVKEYRAEAEQLQAQELKTPQEAGQSAAQSFVWNS